ncbi:hypothetical protein [Citreimonas salinaria]|uniref:Methyltransferase domain-containing protein n=1 Tax=Citreimonas salinaria TaxID=321339 RepID=A0A1H3G5X9_9RHOB|nr:hypothetical protein [Citreimonas salinaria]SDX98048.1 hypothetical protein SAMN05444340_102149 [Citreimonas salinaria]
MSQAAATQRPELTLPEAEAHALRTAYEDAAVILEYGSGGSTVMAAELPGKTVFAVESDKAWAEDMRAWFDANPPAEGTEVHVVWSDIGLTKEWGQPRDDSEWRRWSRYPLGIWRDKGFRQPDVVLVDGRFRVGCALASAFLTQAPLTLLFDDYADRPRYARVEDWLGPPSMIGRMAVFHVEPTPISPDRLLQVVQFMHRP